ncbi:glutamate--tRNA ligase [Chelatococcus asaccharovorans]|uniref:Glutamate--tRNA ligase n=1 Tax=Chelatococcus asaccharovorans TaxID=28210 RepID=A0A2V3TT72_9HYPH|nr:glutamate--tRNA ligase [Chelatococcus asaccharovorans]MBS7702611.1 glutamate--tRNA ligase [Chelatococcus asaccharovorans]PXW52214.1 glutamyl-tRNA synthetase [Chelatococcus asaccharovorans]
MTAHSSPVVRFAPSPTGYLHIGNARPALLNFLYALNHGGRFVLRLDDTDRVRSTQEYADAVSEDLAWLGIEPDVFVRQSDRLALYDDAAEVLRAKGLLYPCYETPDELDRRRKRQLARGKPPIYDRAALSLTAEQRAAFEAEGRKPHWRFLLTHRTVGWTDLSRGLIEVDTATLSDPVLVRGDGTYLYTFTSVVDDLDLGITHVIRGEDHITNTAVQISLIDALDGVVPAFAHTNLLTTASGEGLSKRLGHLSLRGLREQGIEAMAVASLAVLVGSAEAVRPVASLEELAKLVDLARLSHAPAKFDEAELAGLNAKLLHGFSYGAVQKRLRLLGVEGGETFWLAVRGNLERLADAREWWQVVEGPIDPIIEDHAFTARAADLLPPEPWNATTWKSWTEALKAATGVGGRALFMPLRLALTAHDHGPELAALLPLIGGVKAAARLRGERA